MQRSKNGSALTIAELENILNQRRRNLAVLHKQRGKLQKQLQDVDRQIAVLSGRGGINGGPIRARNAVSLVTAMETVLKEAGEPLSVGDILNGVQRRGYTSNSANFRALVNQTLIKEKRFAQASRGMYQLKK
jgi:hypothetical protein